MLSLFSWFITSKIGREVGIGLLALGALAGIYLYGHAAGFKDGHTAGGKETFDQLRGDMETERAKTSAVLAQYDKQLAAKDTEIQASQQVVAQQQAVLATLTAQQAAVRQQISGLSDPQVVLDLATRLQIRAASDSNPALYPQEIRRADEIVGDYAIVTKKFDTLTSTVKEQGVQLAALNDKVNLTQGKFTAAMNYIDESDKRFVNAYNVFNSIEGRPAWQKILTFGILKNKKIQKLTPLTPPDRPAELKK